MMLSGRQQNSIYSPRMHLKHLFLENKSKNNPTALALTLCSLISYLLSSGGISLGRGFQVGSEEGYSPQ